MACKSAGRAAEGLFFLGQFELYTSLKVVRVQIKMDGKPPSIFITKVLSV